MNAISNDTELKKTQRKVKYLLKKPQPAQRSKEWYLLRHTRCTASEVASCLKLSEEVCKIYVDTYNIPKFKYNDAKCLSHYDTEQEYIIKKCRAFYGENVFIDSIYTLWGKKYEEIATRLYRNEYKTKVIEFGFITHPRLKWLGASPDGITPDGVMLEIKCPYSRKIDSNIPPIHYWCQMQVQMETVDLDECDFLECEIKELTEQEYMTKEIIGNQHKGILINKVSEPDNSETKYIYPPDNLHTVEDFTNWYLGQKEANKCVIEPIYYFIEKWNVINVKRSKEWMNIIKPHVKKVYDKIMAFQKDETLFTNFVESVNNIKNSKFIQKWNTTQCLITDAESDIDFVQFKISEDECEDDSIECEIIDSYMISEDS